MIMGACPEDPAADLAALAAAAAGVFAAITAT